MVTYHPALTSLYNLVQAKFPILHAAENAISEPLITAYHRPTGMCSDYTYSKETQGHQGHDLPPPEGLDAHHQKSWDISAVADDILENIDNVASRAHLLLLDTLVLG